MMLLALLTAASASDLADLQADFEDHTGARLVWVAEDLPEGEWFEVLAPLAPEERLWAAAIALREARRYPPGYLADVGVDTVGLFGGLASLADDGYRSWDADLGGYPYFGMWNGRDALIAAAYTARQLPLTFHHEVFHAVDQATGASRDDARFARAVDGREPYPPPRIDPVDLEALRDLRRDAGPVLEGTVGSYTTKSAAEDQAETARHLLSNLPEALVQVVERPDLPGSQRMLHVLAEHEAAPGGPGIAHWVDVALGRGALRERERELARWQALIRPAGTFVVYGAEDARGVNRTLRAQVEAFGADSATLAEVAPRDADPVLVAATMRQLALLAGYLAFIEAHWEVTPGTREIFEAARVAMVGALPDGPLAQALTASSLEELGDVLGEDIDPADVVGALAARGVQVNGHLEALDREATGPALRRVQPATVRLTTARGAASGVNLAPEGRILTAAHVPDEVGARTTIEFPDGTRLAGRCVALDARLDLALIAVEDGVALPWAPIAPAPPALGDPVVVIGQPGARSPTGARTGYGAFHVSVGEIRGARPDPLGDQALGGTLHDAWTYWGHSGSPLFDAQGRIVAMHNSWDPATGMRHAVTWEAIQSFLEGGR